MTTSALQIVAILFALGMSGCFRSHGPSSDAAGADGGIDVTDAQVDGATLSPGCFPGDEAVLLVGPGTGCWSIDVRVETASNVQDLATHFQRGPSASHRGWNVMSDQVFGSFHSVQSKNARYANDGVAGCWS